MITRRRSGAFTLIEVLVALAVVALALGALARTASNAAEVQYQAERRSLALWVASNRLAELELRAALEPGRTQGTTRLGGLDWRWQTDIQPAPGNELWRIDVTVADEGDSVVSVQTGFLAR